MSPIRRNKPPEGLAFYDFFFIVCTTIYICTYSSIIRATGGSAEQPLQVLSGRALNRPKPHPSDKTV